MYNGEGRCGTCHFRNRCEGGETDICLVYWKEKD
jgi:hypothetical protein